MNKSLKTGRLMELLLVLNTIEEAIKLVTKRVKAVADSLEEIDQNLELEVDTNE
jgi:hypothetical protein